VRVVLVAHVQIQYTTVVIAGTRVVVVRNVHAHCNVIAATITHLQMTVTHLSVLISNNNYAEERKSQAECLLKRHSLELLFEHFADVFI
jgi:hypothetical protein